MARSNKKPAKPSSADPIQLLEILRARFEANMHRHSGIKWGKVQEKLEADPESLRALFQMEATGGEPDVIGVDKKTGEYLFVDCSAESPSGRRSICFDQEGLESRKEHRPSDNAVSMAERMGIALLTEEEYRNLQALGEFDTKTSSWLQTPAGIRKLGGALFGDRRYDTVFCYHNGAQSYYAVRGFRGMRRV